MENLPKIKKIYLDINKEMIIVIDKYQFNIAKINKDKSNLYKCTQYKTKFKCKAFFKLDKDKILDYSNDHTHIDKPEDIYKVE